MLLLLLSVALVYPIFFIPIIDFALAIMLVGVILLVHGYGLFDKAQRSPNLEEPPAELPALDRLVLEMISQNKSQDDIVQATGVSPDIVVAKLAALSTSGYILGNRLTEKGFDSLRGKPSTTSK